MDTAARFASVAQLLILWATALVIGSVVSHEFEEKAASWILAVMSAVCFVASVWFCIASVMAGAGGQVWR